MLLEWNLFYGGSNTEKGKGDEIRSNCFMVYIMFKSQAVVFASSGFRPDETRAASLLNGFKNIPGKACAKRVHNNDAFLNVGN